MTTQFDGTAGNDTLTGTTGNDLILGFAGNDRLNGLAGDDTLDGGSGTNQIDAGDGNDTIIIDGSATSANVHVPATGIDGGAGVDTIALSGAQADYHIANILGYGLQITDLTNSQRSLAVNVEHLTFSDGEIWLVPQPEPPAILGTEGDDRLTGTGIDERLFGLGGDDRLNGRAGNDVLTGGAGGDRFVFAGKFGQDVVADFDTAQAGEVLALQAVDGLRGFADLRAHHLTEVAGSAVITVGHAKIVLEGVAMADLTAQDFLF